MIKVLKSVVKEMTEGFLEAVVIENKRYFVNAR